MAKTQSGSGDDSSGLMYFYDFIMLLEDEYAFASVESIAEEIKYARAAGPAIAGLEIHEGSIFVLKAPIGRGDFAIVELEFDTDGVLQPVMGGFLRK